jgi:hypothetical protein
MVTAGDAGGVTRTTMGLLTGIVMLFRYLLGGNYLATNIGLFKGVIVWASSL